MLAFCYYDYVEGLKFQASFHKFNQEAARTGNVYTIRARSKFSHGSSQESVEGGIVQAPFVSTFISAVRHNDFHHT